MAFYNKTGNRLHTIYTAATPEYGKESFFVRFERDIAHIKHLYPKVQYIGIADGAKDNWPFLEKHTEIQITDFWHATEYLGKAANVIYKGKAKMEERTKWLDDRCHKLKHNHGAASRILREMETFKTNLKISKEDYKILVSSITYFKNQKQRMTYAKNVNSQLPIGSGVTEAACKLIVKQRLCCSGMKWKDRGASIVLALRTLSYTNKRWPQFWGKINQYGSSLAA
ncbi:unnamed protein product [marine sediment metagenome]|uniref:Transposase IS204/IS1001/IS1096/IS1165 DDE domain-containing protein n=1 Tax=marine sediment metagenome TaxID=412755 RepID=X0US77_9ZZZZ